MEHSWDVVLIGYYLDMWSKTMDSIIKGCVNCKTNLNKGDIVGI